MNNTINNNDGEELNIAYDDFSFIQSLARCISGSMYIINYKNRGFDYVFGDTFLLGGYSPEEVRAMGYEFYNKVLPAKDLDLLLKINKIGFDFFDRLSLQDRNKYTITYDFYIHSPITQHEILVNQKLTPMLLTKSGKIWKALCTLTMSTSKDHGNIKLINHHGGKNLNYDLETESWVSENVINFSNREKEIITLSIRGFSIQEIAEKIYTSVETVKFHRRSIFEKLNVDNIIDVTTYVISNRIL